MLCNQSNRKTAENVLIGGILLNVGSEIPVPLSLDVILLDAMNHGVTRESGSSLFFDVLTIADMAVRKKEELVFPNAAGIDVGASSHWVAAPPHVAVESVREFGAMTDDLNAMADWLLACGVDTWPLSRRGCTGSLCSRRSNSAGSRSGWSIRAR